MTSVFKIGATPGRSILEYLFQQVKCWSKAMAAATTVS